MFKIIFFIKCASCGGAATTVSATTVAATSATVSIIRASNLRCLDCTSWNSACGDTVAVPISFSISTVPCNIQYQCFTRIDAQGGEFN